MGNTKNKVVINWSPYYPEFQEIEFMCPCCGLIKVNRYAMDKLILARRKAGVPFVITSGTRCSRHNEEIGGASGSTHLPETFGSEGFDIKRISKFDDYKILESLFAVGFNYIKVYKHHIHADTRFRGTSSRIFES